ncbi:hypothetical protein LH53_08355 [Mesotoga sp. TolDC]|nr:hypothetical protein LH53_08355 [Mesotoga sp. TolDC]
MDVIAYLAKNGLACVSRLALKIFPAKRALRPPMLFGASLPDEVGILSNFSFFFAPRTCNLEQTTCNCSSQRTVDR